MATAPPAPNLQTRPRATPFRCILRLRDRLELFLERFVDGDLTAQTEFAIYKAARDRRWAEKDAKSREVLAAAVAISTVTGPTDKTPAGNPVSCRIESLSPGNHIGEAMGLDVPKTRARDKGKEKALHPQDDADTGEAASRATGGSTARRRTSAPQLRTISGSSTFSSFVESTIGEHRRRKRKRSDARPGYFDPDLFPQEPSRDTDATGTGAEGGDRLEMNVPAELARRSWTVPIGTAK
ncbi:hypothetical protein ColTof4_00862 [Colletotrichum tofieldiae]|nr:hypothetical protein ColTof3_08076 [Colletotrichum tofieldiae]GKT68439.1 hypothetical protein ColTof4_00862 [Colletotrichum tofieldiae]